MSDFCYAPNNSSATIGPGVRTTAHTQIEEGTLTITTYGEVHEITRIENFTIFRPHIPLGCSFPGNPVRFRLTSSVPTSLLTSMEPRQQSITPAAGSAAPRTALARSRITFTTLQATHWLAVKR